MVNIRSIWDSQKSTGNIIAKARVNEISTLNCFIATNQITGQPLFIISFLNNIKIPELKKYRFKGVEIFSIEQVNSIDLNIYLLDNDLLDIFTLFIQNILEDIVIIENEDEVLLTTLNVISKWKRLFDKITFNGLSIEQQKGIIGELIFLNHLLNEGKNTTSILKGWTGPDFGDKDFVFGSVGIEIKLTSLKNPKIKITSERQLEIEKFSQVFLILHVVEEVKENGFSLNSLIEQIRHKVLSTEDRDFFNEQLFLLGYREEEKEYYNTLFSLKKTICFTVTNDFPKIVSSQLPIGVYNTSYYIELTAAEPYVIDLDEIITTI